MYHFWTNDSAEPPTHGHLHFEVDDTVCTLPAKCIIPPPLLQVVIGCSCTVRWSRKKQNTARVLFIGVCTVTEVFTNFQSSGLRWINTLYRESKTAK